MVFTIPYQINSKGETNMNSYTNISRELKEIFSSNKVFKILLPLDMILLFIGLAVMILNGIFEVSLGAVINSLGYWIFILGLLLTYANLKDGILYIGLFGYSALCLIELLKYLFRAGHYFSWGSLFSAAIFGGLGYLVFKRTALSSTKNSNLKT